MSARPFPSLIVRAHDLLPQGSFAEALRIVQHPDDALVRRLTELVTRHRVALVAHYYMDPELQGALRRLESPFVTISDSLVMADRAVEMVKSGAEVVVVLGVDFMAENVRAMLDASGFSEISVLRLSERAIGCSLAEAAEHPRYTAYLDQAAATPNSLHVIYINTSLPTKARAEARVPTITCTSSNVVRLLLAAARAAPEIELFFGPDTYMGRNLAYLFELLSTWDSDRVGAAYPGFDAQAMRELSKRFHYFGEGNCVVHHLFGESVAKRIETEYAEDLWTAHLEVPSAMFGLALRAMQEGRGVVGSTSDILDFVGRFVDTWCRDPSGGAHRRVVLGTETGLVTALIERVQPALAAAPVPRSLEIVFPVSADAITESAEPSLPVLPGTASGDGCGVEGSCATCPYMKMNHLDGLLQVLERLAGSPAALEPFAARRPTGDEGVAGLRELSARTILSMREFGQTRRLPEQLLARVRTRRGPP